MPLKFNAFNFTFNHLAEIVHKFCMRMGKAKTKHIPEMKDLEKEQILSLLLHYAKNESIPVTGFPSKTSSIQLKKEVVKDEDELSYKKSMNYFKES